MLFRDGQKVEVKCYAVAAPHEPSVQEGTIIGIFSGLAVDEDNQLVEYRVQFADGTREVCGTWRLRALEP